MGLEKPRIEEVRHVGEEEQGVSEGQRGWAGGGGGITLNHWLSPEESEMLSSPQPKPLNLPPDFTCQSN